MVAPDSYNYHLQSSSPAIGAGVAIVYPTGTTSTTPLPSRDIDFDGISRPNPPAIGAYELPSGNPAATTPTFSPSAGTYASPQTVAINNPSSAPVVCYTTNGTTPVTNGTSGCTTGSVYSSPVSVSVTGTIKAVAGGTGYSDSAVANAVYTINIPAPARNLFAGTLQASGAVKIID
jgi:hypothetical protein